MTLKNYLFRQWNRKKTYWSYLRLKKLVHMFIGERKWVWGRLLPKISWSAWPSVDELKIVLTIATLCRVISLLIKDLFIPFIFSHFDLTQKLQATIMSFFFSINSAYVNSNRGMNSGVQVNSACVKSTPAVWTMLSKWTVRCMNSAFGVQCLLDIKNKRYHNNGG